MYIKLPLQIALYIFAWANHFVQVLITCSISVCVKMVSSSSLAKLKMGPSFLMGELHISIMAMYKPRPLNQLISINCQDLVKPVYCARSFLCRRLYCKYPVYKGLSKGLATCGTNLLILSYIHVRVHFIHIHIYTYIHVHLYLPDLCWDQGFQVLLCSLMTLSTFHQTCWRNTRTIKQKGKIN